MSKASIHRVANALETKMIDEAKRRKKALDIETEEMGAVFMLREVASDEYLSKTIDEARALVRMKDKMICHLDTVREEMCKQIEAKGLHIEDLEKYGKLREKDMKALRIDRDAILVITCVLAVMEFLTITLVLWMLS